MGAMEVDETAEMSTLAQVRKRIRERMEARRRMRSTLGPVVSQLGPIRKLLQSEAAQAGTIEDGHMQHGRGRDGSQLNGSAERVPHDKDGWSGGGSALGEDDNSGGAGQGRGGPMKIVRALVSACLLAPGTSLPLDPATMHRRLMKEANQVEKDALAELGEGHGGGGGGVVAVENALRAMADRSTGGGEVEVEELVVSGRSQLMVTRIDRARLARNLPPMHPLKGGGPGGAPSPHGLELPRPMPPGGEQPWPGGHPGARPPGGPMGPPPSPAMGMPPPGMNPMMMGPGPRMPPPMFGHGGAGMPPMPGPMMPPRPPPPGMGGMGMNMGMPPGMPPRPLGEPLPGPFAHPPPRGHPFPPPQVLMGPGPPPPFPVGVRPGMPGGGGPGGGALPPSGKGAKVEEEVDEMESLLGRKSVKERENQEAGEELLGLLQKPTAKATATAAKFKSKGGASLLEYCDFLTKEDCRRQRGAFVACPKVHFRRLISPHTDVSLGDCSFLDTCRHMKTCKYVHYELDETTDVPPQMMMIGMPGPPRRVGKAGVHYCSPEELGEPQWVNCDIRTFDYSTLGKFGIIMADPPWDIHMELPYGTMQDDEMRKLNWPVLQTDGLMFLWVTGRAMELGRDCLQLWGYKRVEELIWVKTNQLQRIIRTGRTGHWLNHSKEHCLVGIKGNPEINRNIDCDVLVAEVRETSRKPDEMYPMLERLSPGTRKIELFARPHNTRPGWISLGNQLPGTRLVDPEIRRRFRSKYPDVEIEPKDRDERVGFDVEESPSTSVKSPTRPPGLEAGPAEEKALGSQHGREKGEAGTPKNSGGTPRNEASADVAS